MNNIDNNEESGNITFHWQIEDNIWSDEQFILSKIETSPTSKYLHQNSLYKQINLIDKNMWKSEDFIKKAIAANSNVITALFAAFPLYSNLDDQIALETRLLQNLPENQLQNFDQIWNSYLKYNYIYWNRNDEFTNYIGSNQIQFMIDKKEAGLFGYFYEEGKGINYNNKAKYKVIIDFLNNELFQPSFIKKVNSDTFKEDQYEQYIWDKLSYSTNRMNGEAYAYLPENFRMNEKNIDNYLTWVGNNIAEKNLSNSKSNDIKKPIRKQLSNIYIDDNIIPEQWFDGSHEKMESYLVAYLLNTFSTKENLTHKSSRAKRNNMIMKWISDEDTCLQVIDIVVGASMNQLEMVWDKLIPENFKTDKNFILKLYDLCSHKYLDKNYYDFLMIYEKLKDNPNKNLQHDSDIQKAYLANKGKLSKILKFNLYDLDDKQDEKLIEQIIKEHVHIFVYDASHYQDDTLWYMIKEEAYNKHLAKNQEVLDRWKTNINFFTTQSVLSTELELSENQWDILLSQDDALEKLKKYPNILNFLPEKAHTKQLVLDMINTNKSMSVPIKEEYYDSPVFCQWLLKAKPNLITQVPDKHWDNKNFIFNIFNDIDEGEIQASLINNMPQRIKQFLEAYEINKDYAKNLNMIMLQQKLNNHIENKPNDRKKLKI